MSGITVDTLVEAVRRFLRDQPKLNELRGIQESTPDDIRFAINMSVSDWNSTPPLIARVTLENFPSFDWLVVSTAMWVLQSAGVLQYRNELAYSDGGVNVNPWTKGPQYINLAGMWAQMVQQKKIELKTAINYGQTFGYIKSSEYLVWDYAGLYTGPQTPGGVIGSLSQMAPVITPADSVGKPIETPNRRLRYDFKIADWQLEPSTARYRYAICHNLLSDVDVKVVSPAGQDLRSKMEIFYPNQNVVQLYVPASPDGRMDGSVTVYKI